MYKYYIEKNFNPTYAKLEEADRFKKYVQQRCFMLQNRLCLPLRIFADAHLLEFGPAGGENALIAAIWGANLQLVEPVEAFHRKIRDYFDQYGQTERLQGIVTQTLLEYEADPVFDIVLAEGFVYTTGPAEKWTRKLASFCCPQGLVLFNIYETGGALIEVLQSRICRISSARHGSDPVAIARLILGEKWSMLSHSRSFSAWVNDVLYNPFVDFEYFNHCGDIAGLMFDQGFDLYSSWPSLSRPMDISWIKRVPSLEERLVEHQTTALKLLPSMIIGEPVVLYEQVDTHLLHIFCAVLREEVKAICRLDEHIEQSDLLSLIELHRETDASLREIAMDYDQSRLARLMREIEQCIGSLQEPPERMRRFFASGSVISSVWGSPNHYLVFQKMPSSA